MRVWIKRTVGVLRKCGSKRVNDAELIKGTIDDLDERIEYLLARRQEVDRMLSEVRRRRNLWMVQQKDAITNREQTLIVKALFILECQCRGDELNCEISGELGGTPDPKEIRKLMGKVSFPKQGPEPGPKNSKTWSAGFRAGLGGEPARLNPFLKTGMHCETTSWREWQAGWVEAQKWKQAKKPINDARLNEFQDSS